MNRDGNLVFPSCHSFKKSDGSESPLLLFTKRAKGANRAKVQSTICSFKSDLLFLRVHVEETTLNLFFSPCFSPFYAQNKRVNCSSSFFSLFVKDWIAPVTLLKRATRAIHSCRSIKKSNKRKSLSSLFSKRATRVICSFKRANRSFALSLSKNERFTQKTKERIPNPGFENQGWVLHWRKNFGNILI